MSLLPPLYLIRSLGWSFHEEKARNGLILLVKPWAEALLYLKNEFYSFTGSYLTKEWSSLFFPCGHLALLLTGLAISLDFAKLTGEPDVNVNSLPHHGRLLTRELAWQRKRDLWALRANLTALLRASFLSLIQYIMKALSVLHECGLYAKAGAWIFTW